MCDSRKSIARKVAELRSAPSSPAEQAEVELRTRVAQGVDEETAIGGIGEDAHTSVGARGDKLQMSGFENAMINRHDSRALQNAGQGSTVVSLAGADLKGKVCASPPNV